MSEIRVMLIDDDEALLRVLARGLRRQYLTVTARTGDEAVKIASDPAQSPTLVVCDVTMGEETGLDVYRRLGGVLPDVQRRFSFMTGGGLTDDQMAAIERTGCRVLEKPVDVARLADHVAECARDLS